MKAYRNYQKFVVIFLALYLVIGYGFKLTQDREIFPIFSWSLFTNVPNQINDYGIRIVAIDGQELDTPFYYEEGKDTFIDYDSAQAYFNFRDFGRALTAGNTERVEEIRGYLESLYLEEAGQIRYEVVARSWDAVDRWNGGGFLTEEVIAVYETGQ